MPDTHDHLFFSSPLVLAQRGAGGEAPATEGQDGSGTDPQGSGGGGGAQGSPFGGTFMLILFALLLFMIITTAMGGRKQKKQRQEMLGSLNKHDKVQTIGGVIGTIVEIKDGELVLQVDERSETRIRFSRSAIQQVLRQGKAGEEAAPAEVAQLGPSAGPQS